MRELEGYRVLLKGCPWAYEGTSPQLLNTEKKGLQNLRFITKII